MILFFLQRKICNEKFSFPKFGIQNHFSLTKWQHSRCDKVGEVAEVERKKRLDYSGNSFVNTPVSAVPDVHYLISCPCLSLSVVLFRCLLYCSLCLLA